VRHGGFKYSKNNRGACKKPLIQNLAEKFLRGSAVCGKERQNREEKEKKSKKERGKKSKKLRTMKKRVLVI
jgi:hypothetical protein